MKLCDEFVMNLWSENLWYWFHGIFDGFDRIWICDELDEICDMMNLCDENVWFWICVNLCFGDFEFVEWICEMGLWWIRD